MTCLSDCLLQVQLSLDVAEELQSHGVQVKQVGWARAHLNPNPNPVPPCRTPCWLLIAVADSYL